MPASISLNDLCFHDSRLESTPSFQLVNRVFSEYWQLVVRQGPLPNRYETAIMCNGIQVVVVWQGKIWIGV